METGNEHGPSDVLHAKGMTSADGLRGLSPVSACRLALTLSSSLQTSAAALSANDARPSGILTVPAPQADATVEDIRERWDARHGGPPASGRIAVVAGDVGFTPVAFSAADTQFLQQRELSAREVARIFRVPAWLIDAPTGDSLTYTNVLEQNRAFVSHSLRPWLVRLERAISGDPDLCPGNTYVEFNLDGLLRADAGARAQIYTAALNPTTGWMTRPEVRELEDLPPEPEPVPVRSSAPNPSSRRHPMPERPVAGTLEERTLPVEVEDGRRLRGLIPYGVESRDLGGWRELIDPAALRGAALDDLVVTVEHAGVPLGRYPRTLEVEERDDGLHWSVEPPRARADVIEAVERGDLRAGSWRMRVARDEWRGDVRHVLEIAELRDVALVAAPAYPSAAVELRTAPEEEHMPETPTIEETPPEPSLAPEEDRSAPEGPGLPVEAATASSGRAGGLTDRFRNAGFPASGPCCRSRTCLSSAP